MNINRLSLNTLQDVAAALNFMPEVLASIAGKKDSLYYAFTIKKHNGVDRVITPPKDPLKEVQKRIKAYLDDKLVWSSSVHGGVRGRDILSNAKPHTNKAMVANLDISSFFPNTTRGMILDALRRVGCGEEAAGLLADLTTFNDGLPQGSPTSTMLGNLVLEPMDSDFKRLCRKHHLDYTRFIDDLTVSGPVDLERMKGAFLDLIIKSGFKPSEGKTRFTPRHERQEVTGLVVNDLIRPGREFIISIKRDLRSCWLDGGPEILAMKDGMTIKELFQSLWGKIRFVERFDQKLGKKLIGYMAGCDWPWKRDLMAEAA